MTRDNDNTLAQATDLGTFPGSNSITKQGNVNSSDDDIDLYRINISAPTRLTAALTSGTSDAGLKLLDANGVTLIEPRNLIGGPDVLSSDN
ncbi:MAG TPA: hypothetical protein V6C65_00460, partial [Allocoleopsis sp.]